MSAAERTILLVCDYSLSYMGGAQTALRRQAEALADNGIRCIVLAPGRATAWDPRIVVLSPPVRFTVPRIDLPILASYDSLSRLTTEIIREHAVDAVVVHSELALAAAAIASARADGLMSLHTVHTFFWRAPAALSPFAPLVTRFHTRTTRLPREPRSVGSTPIQNALRSMTLRVASAADEVLSPSEHQAEALRAAGVRRVNVVSNVVESVAPAAASAAGPLRVLWAARFAPEKRLDVALQALQIVRRTVGPGRVQLHVAGGWHRPVHDATFHSRVDAQRIDELIAASDAVLITSVGFDNQPMIALEAFRRGRPVIVSDPALAREFGSAAIQAPMPDAAGLAAALIAHCRGRDGLAAAGTAALAFAQARDARTHARRILELLDGSRAAVAMRGA